MIGRRCVAIVSPSAPSTSMDRVQTALGYIYPKRDDDALQCVEGGGGETRSVECATQFRQALLDVNTHWAGKGYYTVFDIVLSAQCGCAMTKQTNSPSAPLFFLPRIVCVKRSRRTCKTPMYAMHEAGGDQPTTLRDDATPPRQQRAQGGNGTTLYVPGLADERAARNGCTSAFLSSGSIADAHIKNLKFISDGHFTPQMHYMTPRKSPSESRFGSSAFAAKVDDRYSYLPKAVNDPMSSFYSSASPTLSNPSRSGGSTERPGSSQQRRPSSPTAAFRSRTPIACAHQNNPRPVDPHFMADDAPQLHYGSPSSVVRVRPTSSFRTSADRDSYIKAQPQVLDSYSPLRSDFDKCRPKIAGSPRESTSSFRSKASIGDAHIRALNRPVDVCVSYVSLKSANH